MALNKELLSILACPACKSEIKEEGEWLLCLNSSCALKYPVRNGIPVMLIDQAVKQGKA